MKYEPSEAAHAGRFRLSANLRSLREQRGMTQEALAHAAGLDRSFLVELEGGLHSCAVDRLFDLAEALDVDAARLLGQPQTRRH